MNTRRLTKKYKHKSRSKKTRKSRKTRRRVLKGGVSHSVRPSSRASSRPSSDITVSRTSGRGSSIRPSVSGISKVSCCDKVNIANRKIVINSINNNFHFNDVYNKLMNTDVKHLPSTIESMKLGYTAETTLEPSRAYLNMKGLKFVNYLYGKYQHSNTNDKEKIRSIISLFDQYGMSHGIRNYDLPIVEGQVDKRYFACYKDLYEEIYKKLFPRGNNDYYPVSLSAIPLYCKPRLQTVHEDIDEQP